MTSSEVAKLLGLSLRRVTQGGKALGVRMYGHQYWWEEDEVMALKARMGKRGRKRTEKPE